MQISSRFTIAILMLGAIEYFSNQQPVMSALLANSVGTNPVTIRNLMSSLKAAGMIETQQGRAGIRLLKPLDEIRFYDVYMAVDAVDDAGLFSMHDQPDPECPIGSHIETALSNRLTLIQKTMEAELAKLTVADVAEDIHTRLV